MHTDAKELHFCFEQVTVPPNAHCTICGGTVPPGPITALMLYTGDECVAVTCKACTAEYGAEVTQ